MDGWMDIYIYIYIYINFFTAHEAVKEWYLKLAIISTYEVTKEKTGLFPG